jgi:hypothetical protein
MPMLARSLITGLAVLAAQSVHAATTVYTQQSSFEAALGGSYTLVNLDAPPLNGFASGYRLGDPMPAAALAGLGLTSVGLNAQVAAGQNFQTVLNRDRLILNGQAFGGQIAFNFDNAVNGVGAYSNTIDYGRIRLFSGTNLGGTFLGETQFGPGGFGGITSDTGVRSVQLTCDFNQDLACGVFDIQFGTFATTAVPEPRSWVMLVAGFGLIGAVMRRRPQPSGAAI